MDLPNPRTSLAFRWVLASVFLAITGCDPEESCEEAECADSNPCTVDRCSASGQCENVPAADGAVCDDGDANTTGDVCTTSVCAGERVSCDDANACTDDVLANGSCSHTNKAAGAACDDGVALTTGDQCQDGVCAGTPPSCDDGNACTEDSFDGTVCRNVAVTDGAACDDSNACTQADSCQTGVCTGSNPVTCTAQDQCHTAGVCDPQTGACSNPAVDDNTACNDGNLCTTVDSCQAGACTGSSPVTCVAQDQCHAAGVCDPGTGTCSNPALNDGTLCDDANLCTTTDVCLGGQCSGETVTCDDSNGCTADSCDPSDGQCHNVSCDDGNACTTGVCDPATETCSHDPIYVCSPALVFPDMASAASELATPWNQAVIADGKLRLNWSAEGTSGLALFRDRVSAREGFTAKFSFEFWGGVRTGADGMAFVLHDSPALIDPDATTSTQSPAYGEHGLADSQTLAVSFDSYQNSGETSAKRIVVSSGGVVRATVSLTGDWSDSGVHEVELRYVPGALSVTVDGTEHVTAAAVDLESAGAVDADGRAFIGFSSRTGWAYEAHDVLSFEYRPTCPSGSCGDGAACSSAVCDPGTGCNLTEADGDEDGDETCDSNDACPGSSTDDADDDGACDDEQVCAALGALASSATAQTGLSAEPSVSSSALSGLTLTYEWFRDGVLHSTASTLPAGVTQAGESWRARVLASHGGVAVCEGSREFTITPRLPVCTAAAASHTPGAPGLDGLSCDCVGLDDPDSVLTGYECSFDDQTGAAIGTSTGGAGDNGCTLYPVSLTSGQVVTCSVTPVTATATGESASSTVQIGSNQPPVLIDDMSLTIIGLSTSRIGNVVCIDNDHYERYVTNTPDYGDPEGIFATHRFRYFVNGVQVHEAFNLRPFTYLSPNELQEKALALTGREYVAGDTLECRMDLWDGALGSTRVYSQSSVVGTSAPRADGHLISPDPVQARTTMSCEIGIWNWDVDDAQVELFLSMNQDEDPATGFARQTVTVPGGTNTKHWVSITTTAPSSVAGQNLYCGALYTDADTPTPTPLFMASSDGAGANPVMSTPVLSLTEGSVCSPVVCTATLTDADAVDSPQSAQTEVSWLVDGAPYGSATVTSHTGIGTSGTTVSVTASELPLQGHTIACRVRARPDASSDWSTDVTSSAVTLLGTPPSVASVSITGAELVRDGDTLTCAAVAASGSCDSSTKTFRYQWAANGTPVSGQTGTTYTTTGLAAGDVVTCGAQVATGSGEYSAVVWSSGITLYPGTWTVVGDDPGSYFGMSVAIVDDLDGDGFGELLAGAPWSDPLGKVSSGQVYLLRGELGGTDSLSQYAGGAYGARIFTGEGGSYDTDTNLCSMFENDVCQPDRPLGLNDPYRGPVGDALGTRVLAPGDMDGDGTPDLVLAAPWAKGSGGFRQGRTYAVSGRTAQGGSMYLYSSGVLDGWAVDGEVGLLSNDVDRGITSRQGDLSGYTVAPGDFDGDGLADLAIGSPEYGSVWSVTEYGSVSWISSGGNLGSTAITYGSATRRGILWLHEVATEESSDRATFIRGRSTFANTFANYGSALSFGGDLDGNGKDDLYMGTTGMGYPWILRSDALNGDDVDLASVTPSESVYPIAPNFSASLTSGNSPMDWIQSGKLAWWNASSGVGDVNGDGRDDVAIAWFEPHFLVVSVFTDPAQYMTDLDGPKTGVGGFAITGVPSAGVAGGVQTHPVGDVDGDGYDDFAVIFQGESGSTATTSRIYVVYGRAETTALTFAQIENGTAGFTIDTGEVLSYYAVSSGELDGDGLSDIVYGAALANSNAGKVVVRFGRDGRGRLTDYGTSAAETLTGSSGADAIVGGGGSDYLVGGGGADALNGGAGDDVLEISDSSFVRVQGGSGVDTLRLTAGDLNLTQLRGKVRDVEVVDLSSGSHTLTATAIDVLRLSSTSNALYVLGGEEDTLESSGSNWLFESAQSIGGVAYRTYASGNARLHLQESISSRIPPTFTTPTTLRIVEGPADGSAIGQITAVDPDGQIASLAFTSGDTTLFGFDPLTGALTVVDGWRFDYEGRSSWTLEVTATDESGLTTTGTVTVELEDAPEAPAFVAASASVTTYEGVDEGTALLDASATDQDSGDVLTWSIVDGNTDGAFAVDSATGALSVLDGTQLDYETEPVRTVRVKVTDSVGLYDYLDVTVTLVDVNSFAKRLSSTFSRSDVSLWTGEPTWAWNSNDNVNDPEGRIELGGNKTIALPSTSLVSASLDVTTSGALVYNGRLMLDEGEFAVSLPMAVDLAYPEQITPGQAFQMTATASLTGTVEFSGYHPKLDFSIGFELDQVRMAFTSHFSSSIMGGVDKTGSDDTGYINTGNQTFEVQYGGEPFTGTHLGATYPAGVTVGPDGVTGDTHLDGAAYNLTGIRPEDANATLTNPNVFYSQRVIAELYDGYLDWDSWLREVFPAWVGVNSGSVEYPVGSAIADIDWDLFPNSFTKSKIPGIGGESAGAGPSSMSLWAGMHGSYAIEWRGAEVTLTFEDGSTSSFELDHTGVQTTQTFTVPQTADVDGNGRVDITASATPKVRFYNWSEPYFRVDAYWFFAAFKARLYDIQINQFSGQAYTRTLYSTTVGPALSWGVSISDNFDDYLAETLDTTSQFESYWTVRPQFRDNFDDYRSHFDVTGFRAATVKGSVQFVTP